MSSFFSNNAFPKKILLGLQEGNCNLSCPKCYTHGSNQISSNTRPNGIMPFDQFIKLLDECVPFQPRIAPQTWDEPLLNSNILEYLSEIKKRKLVTTMDTNGILLNDKAANALIDLSVDSVFISLDAMTEDTYSKVRGHKRFFSMVQNAVLRLLKMRGDKMFPRIGVSYVIEDENEHELESFINFWTPLVDVVRVNKKFEAGRKIRADVSSTIRTPCWSLYDSLMIHYDGSAALCCVDNHYENSLGNVFTNGVSSVWNGSYFQKARQDHENGDLSRLKICQSCDLWTNNKSNVTETTSLLISETLTHKYYNKKSRLSNISDNRYL